MPPATPACHLPLPHATCRSRMPPAAPACRSRLPARGLSPAPTRDLVRLTHRIGGPTHKIPTGARRDADDPSTRTATCRPRGRQRPRAGGRLRPRIRHPHTAGRSPATLRTASAVAQRRYEAVSRNRRLPLRPGSSATLRLAPQRAPRRLIARVPTADPPHRRATDSLPAELPAPRGSGRQPHTGLKPPSREQQVIKIRRAGQPSLTKRSTASGAGRHGAGRHGAGRHGAGRHGAGRHGAGRHGTGRAGRGEPERAAR
jgi:hypothetical protein